MRSFIAALLFAASSGLLLPQQASAQRAVINWAYGPFGTPGDAAYVIEDGRIWIETIRDVASGDELAYDYAFVLPERHTPAAKRRYPCNCGARNCRGTILAKKR